MERKIGFVVEGDIDKVVVETLSHRLLGSAVRAYGVRLGGSMAVRWAYSTVLTLLEEKQYPHVVLLLDAGAVLEPEIDRKRKEIAAMLAEHDIGAEEVSVCLAVPQIEAWLLAEFEEHPEESEDPKQALMNRMNVRRLLPADVHQLARSLDIAKARSRSPSFDEFVRTLERVGTRLTRAA
jgi:hypothetical protein